MVKLKEHLFIVDLMKINPDEVRDIVMDSLSESSASIDSETRDIVVDMISNCDTMVTGEGLEACINYYREDLSRDWRGKIYPGSKFDRFLEALNEKFAKAKQEFGIEHKL